MSYLTFLTPNTIENPTIDQIANTTDAGSGSITFTNSTTGGATLQKIIAGDDAYVQMTLTDLTNTSDVILAVDHQNNAVYSWTTNQPSFDLAVYSSSSNTYYAVNSDQGTATLLEASQANDILQIKKVSTGFEIWRSRSSVWSKLQSISFTYKTNFYVKLMNPTQGTSKQIYSLSAHGLTTYIYPVTSSERQVTFTDLLATTDQGSGTLTVSDGIVPAGAMCDKRLGGIGSYIRWTIPSPVSKINGILVSICEGDDANYGWGLGSWSLGVAVGGTTVYYYQNSNTLPATSTGFTVAAGNVLRIYRVGQNEYQIQKSTDGGSTYSTGVRLVAGQFSNNPFVKIIVNDVGSSLTVNNIAIYGSYNKSSYAYPVGKKAMFYFTGESNSGGVASNAQATSSETAAQTNTKILNNTTLTSFDGLQIGVNNLVGHAGLTDNSSHSWELELMDMTNQGYLSSTTYIVKTGQGGTLASQWLVGGTYSGVNCWQKFLDRTNAAATLFATTEPTSTLLPIVFFDLGANDWVAGTNLATFKTNLKDFMNRIKTQLGSSTRLVAIQAIPVGGTMIGYNRIIRESCLELGFSFVAPDYLTPLAGPHEDYRSKKNQTWRMLEKILP